MTLSRSLRVVGARAHQILGWAGLAGSALLAAALLMTAAGWRDHKRYMEDAEHRAFELSRGVLPKVPVAVPVPVDPPAELPRSSDVPLLLGRLQAAAVNAGFGWKSAEYRAVAAATNQPASLEVRVGLKGSYPKLRAMLSELHAAVPGLAIREFSANRPNADMADIETRLTLAILLQDELSSSLPAKAVP